MAGPSGYQVVGTDFGIDHLSDVSITAPLLAGQTLQWDGSTYWVNDRGWQAWSPTVTASAGALTSYTVNAGYYFQAGKLIVARLDVTITDNGTGSGCLQATLPATPAAGYPGTAMAHETLSHAACSGFVDTAASLLSLWKYDGTYPAGTGSRFVLFVCYEAA